MIFKQSPSMRKHFLILLSFNCLNLLQRTSVIIFRTTFGFLSDMTNNSKSARINLQLFAMFSAVSSLSPVNIQTLMSSLNKKGEINHNSNKQTYLLLALSKSWIVSGTSSCSLSSTAVAPSKKNPLSTSSASFSVNNKNPSLKLIFFFLLS